MTMRIRTALLNFERESGLLDDKPEGYVCGWASSDSVDSYNEVIEYKAFAGAIAKRGTYGPSGIKLLLNHDTSKVAGVIEELEYRYKRLWIAAQMNLDIGYVYDVYRAAKSAGGLSFSVGFTNGVYKEGADGRDHILEADLMEVSIVTFPANADCSMTGIKSAQAAAADTAKTIAEFEKSLVEQGYVKSRREANSIVRAIKACPLFAIKEAALMERETQPLRRETNGEPLTAEIAELCGMLAGFVKK